MVQVLPAIAPLFGRYLRTLQRESACGLCAGVLTPFSAVEGSPCRFLVGSAPLCEKESCAVGATPILTLLDPIHLHRPGAGTGFTSYDGPIDIGQVDGSNWADQRFKRNEADE